MKCAPTSFYLCKLLLNLKRVRTSLPFRGQLITDTYTRKFVHMLIIPFPVCASINYKKRRMNSRLPFCNKLRHTYKQEMELLTCGQASCYMCQLLTDLQRVRTTLPFELVLLVNFLISLKNWISSKIGSKCTCLGTKTRQLVTLVKSSCARQTRLDSLGGKVLV